MLTSKRESGLVGTTQIDKLGALILVHSVALESGEHCGDRETSIIEVGRSLVFLQRAWKALDIHDAGTYEVGRGIFVMLPFPSRLY